MLEREIDISVKDALGEDVYSSFKKKLYATAFFKTLSLLLTFYLGGLLAGAIVVHAAAGLVSVLGFVFVVSMSLYFIAGSYEDSFLNTMVVDIDKSQLMQRSSERSNPEWRSSLRNAIQKQMYPLGIKVLEIFSLILVISLLYGWEHLLLITTILITPAIKQFFNYVKRFDTSGQSVGMAYWIPRLQSLAYLVVFFVLLIVIHAIGGMCPADISHLVFFGACIFQIFITTFNAIGRRHSQNLGQMSREIVSAEDEEYELPSLPSQNIPSLAYEHIRSKPMLYGMTLIKSIVLGASFYLGGIILDLFSNHMDLGLMIVCSGSFIILTAIYFILDSYQNTTIAEDRLSTLFIPLVEFTFLMGLIFAYGWQNIIFSLAAVLVPLLQRCAVWMRACCKILAEEELGVDFSDANQKYLMEQRSLYWIPRFQVLVYVTFSTLTCMLVQHMGASLPIHIGGLVFFIGVLSQLFQIPTHIVKNMRPDLLPNLSNEPSLYYSLSAFNRPEVGPALDAKSSPGSAADPDAPEAPLQDGGRSISLGGSPALS